MFAYVHWRSLEYLRSPCLTCDLTIDKIVRLSFNLYVKPSVVAAMVLRVVGDDA